MTIDESRQTEMEGGEGLIAAAVSLRARAASGGPSALRTYAASLLGLIHEARDRGRPGVSAFFALEAGPAYVQALARPGETTVQLEFVSAKSDPEVARILTPGKIQRLAELGFSSPGARSPNYCQFPEVGGQAERDWAGALMATALAEVFGVRDLSGVDTRFHAPGAPIVTISEPSARA